MGFGRIQEGLSGIWQDPSRIKGDWAGFEYNSVGFDRIVVGFSGIWQDLSRIKWDSSGPERIQLD